MGTSGSTGTMPPTPFLSGSDGHPPGWNPQGWNPNVIGWPGLPSQASQTAQTQTAIVRPGAGAMASSWRMPSQTLNPQFAPAAPMPSLPAPAAPPPAPTGPIQGPQGTIGVGWGASSQQIPMYQYTGSEAPSGTYYYNKYTPGALYTYNDAAKAYMPTGIRVTPQ